MAALLSSDPLLSVTHCVLQNTHSYKNYGGSPGYEAYKYGGDAYKYGGEPSYKYGGDSYKYGGDSYKYGGDSSYKYGGEPSYGSDYDKYDSHSKSKHHKEHSKVGNLSGPNLHGQTIFMATTRILPPHLCAPLYSSWALSSMCTLSALLSSTFSGVNV